MVKEIKTCVDCGLPCQGSNCSQYEVVYICDVCGEEVDELYQINDDEQMCKECLITNIDDLFDKVK